MLKVYCAPLQGYTEDVYRRLHHRMFGGVEQYFTPFVRLEHGAPRSKDLRDVNPLFNADVPVVPQIICNSAVEFRQLMEVLLPSGYRQIDINMGCPFPLQTRHGRGAGLLTQPDVVSDICRLMPEYAPVQFSVKMRLGLDDATQWQEILPLLNDAPLHHITLHPRIATQQYKGDVDMRQFRLFAARCQHPLIYNGDLTSVEQMLQVEQSFPSLSGLMLGRGLLARPSLAIEYQQGEVWAQQRLLAAIGAMHNQLLQHYTRIIPSESQRLSKVRTFWDYMEPTLGRKVWKRILKAGNLKNYLAAVGEALT